MDTLYILIGNTIGQVAVGAFYSQFTSQEKLQAEQFKV
jgi:hypothetical protein